QIGAESIEVEALVTSTATDPHSYEATPQDRLAVENADVIIANGAGYDSFITLLASSAQKEDAVYQVADGENSHHHDHGARDHDHGGQHQNEHLWYDLPQMEQLATDLADHLGELAPQHAELYAQNADQLAEQISALDERSRQLDASGHSYLATEAVSGYLLDHA